MRWIAPRMPEMLSGVRHRRPVLSVAWLVLVLLAVAQITQLSAVIIDSSRLWGSTTPDQPSQIISASQHMCTQRICVGAVRATCTTNGGIPPSRRSVHGTLDGDRAWSDVGGDHGGPPPLPDRIDLVWCCSAKEFALALGIWIVMRSSTTIGARRLQRFEERD
jgi:hypothetical protein